MRHKERRYASAWGGAGRLRIETMRSFRVAAAKSGLGGTSCRVGRIGSGLAFDGSMMRYRNCLDAL